MELPHLIVRWIHLLSAFMWIGQIWSLAVVLRLPPDQPATAEVAPLLRRAYIWLRWSAALTWLTGVGLLGIVYYGGGALSTPEQSAGLAMGIGFTALFGSWVVYDTIWRFLGRRPVLAGLLCLALLAGAAVWLTHVMTGRAVFIHVGAMLGTIMMVNVDQRIWPAMRRQLGNGPRRSSAPLDAMTAAVRLRHNAILAVAVIFFMLSNHFPLVYGHRQAWAVVPSVVLLAWFLRRAFSTRIFLGT
jgi:uncharacterized membrane protein